MKIAVCVKQALDVSQLKIDEKTKKPLTTIVPRKMNDLDRNSIEEALRIKEKVGGTVTAITFGNEKAKETLREALAMGADEAILIIDDLNVEEDEYITAQILSRILMEKGPFDIILCGEMSIDRYSSQIGPRIAEKLEIPCITYVRSTKIEDEQIIVERDLEDRTEMVKTKLPVLLTVTREINTPRLPPLMAILKAARKNIEKISARDLKIDLQPQLKTIELKGVEVRRKNIIIKDKPVEEEVRELIRYLTKESVLEG